MSEAKPVAKGTVVKVLPLDKHYHGFTDGEIVVSDGEGFMGLSTGDWTLFTNEDGYQQYMLPHHYEVVKGEVVTPEVTFPVLEEGETGIVEDLPGKVVYAVIKSDGEIYTLTGDRDYARTIKAALGGKRKGAKIFHYAPVKEIR